VRFTCPKCGKKYASSAEPAPGKVYRLKCKACGEPITISAAAPAEPRPGGASRTPPPIAGPPPIATAAPTPTPTPTSTSTSTPISTSTSTSTRIPADLPTVTAIEIPSPSDEPALDLKSLLGEEGQGEGTDEPLSPRSALAAAARSSLPEGYGTGAAGAPDPFAALTRDPASPPPASRPAPEPPRFASVTKPPGPRMGATLVLLGLGLLVLLAVLAFAVLRGKAPEAGRPARPPAAAERPVTR